MNERIKKLFDKSVKYTASQDDGTKNQVMMNRICAEYFARQIIDRCIIIASHSQSFHPEESVAQKLYDEFGFGVEE